ncbi:hypothetical protein QOZ80_5AG0409080 [Eleusine coracana subsp. coracana]|nr:hypothetical protein QOZ80_5AG0409080 [Eleusine coracana subsp. coracana]
MDPSQGHTAKARHDEAEKPSQACPPAYSAPCRGCSDPVHVSEVSSTSAWWGSVLLLSSSIPEVIVDADPPGFTRVPADLERRLLAPSVQQLMFHCIRMVDDMFKSGHSIDNLSECNILICKSSFLPKLMIGLTSFSRRNKRRFEANMSSLAAITRATLFTSHTPPAEVELLLRRMEGGAIMLYRHLIRFHPCLFPIENRCEYFYRMHSFIVDVLQKDRRDHATFVFKNILCSADWESKARCNIYLQDYLNHSTYDPTNTEDEPTRLHRNCVCHDLAYATSHPNNPGPSKLLRITRTDMARILYSVFSLLHISLAEALNCLDELHNLSLATLFSSHYPLQLPLLGREDSLL